MGQYLGIQDFKDLEASSYYSFPYNKELKLSDWEGYNAKNYDYYSGKRMFKVSRSLYTEYDRGYLYGYYYNPYELARDIEDEDDMKDDDDDAELERAL